MDEREKKSFDFAGDVTKQLITLSIGILTLCIAFTVHHRAPPLSKTGNNISISTLQILLKVVTFAQASK